MAGRIGLCDCDSWQKRLEAGGVPVGAFLVFSANLLLEPWWLVVHMGWFSMASHIGSSPLKPHHHTWLPHTTRPKSKII